MTLIKILPAVAAALLAGSVTAFAQQPAQEPPQQDAPSFSNDDVPVSQPVPPRESTANPDNDIDPKTQSDPSLTEEERMDAEQSAGAAAQPGAAKGPSPAEQNWRLRYVAAQRVHQDAVRMAQEAEIKITELRNQLSKSGADVRLRQELEDAGEALTQARTRATSAQSAFDQVKAEGAAKRFSLAPAGETTGPKPSPRDAIRTQYAEAKRALDDANRRVTLYQNRVSDLNLRITLTSGTGDNYAIANLQAELNEARSQLTKAQADLQVAQQTHERARRAAMGAGVSVRDLQ